MLVWGASDGSLAELAACMLMHRAAKGRAHVRCACARVLEGAAAGRNMAAPVNWRTIMDECGVESKTAEYCSSVLSALPRRKHGKHAADGQ